MHFLMSTRSAWQMNTTSRIANSPVVTATKWFPIPLCVRKSEVLDIPFVCDECFFRPFALLNIAMYGLIHNIFLQIFSREAFFSLCCCSFDLCSMLFHIIFVEEPVLLTANVSLVNTINKYWQKAKEENSISKNSVGSQNNIAVRCLFIKTDNVVCSAAAPSERQRETTRFGLIY